MYTKFRALGIFDFLKRENRSSSEVKFDITNALAEAVGRTLYRPGSRDSISYGLENIIRYGYEENPHGRTVIDFIAGRLSQIKPQVYEVQEDGQLEKVDESDPLAQFIKNPNEKQHTVDFSYEAHVQYNLLGNNFIYFLQGVGNEVPTKMYNMPAQQTEIVSGGWREPIKGYTLEVDNKKKQIGAREVAHRKQYNPNVKDGIKDLFGLPKMKSLYRTVQRSNNAYDAGIAAFENGMPALIVSPEKPNGLPLTDEESKELEKAWLKRFGGGKNSKKVLRSTISLKADVIGLSPAELELLKSNEYDLRDFCRVFGFSSVLVSDTTQSKHDIFKQAQREFWENVGIPQLNDFMECLNQTIGKAYSKLSKKKYKIWYDLKDIHALQEDLNLKQDRLLNELQNNLITFGQYHTKMGQETPNVDHMDLYWKDLNSNDTNESNETDESI